MQYPKVAINVDVNVEVENAYQTNVNVLGMELSARLKMFVYFFFSSKEIYWEIFCYFFNPFSIIDIYLTLKSTI